MVTPLCFGQGHMSVGDSAEEFISVHALGRERLLVLSCGLPSHPLKILLFARWETIEFLSQISTHQLPNVILTEVGRRPPQITGRRVSAVHQGGVGAPNELAMFRVYNPVVDFIERSVWRTRIAPRLIEDLLEKFSGRCWLRSPREIVFFRNSGKFQQTILPNWVHRRPSRQSLARILGISKFWPSIVTGL